MSNGVIRHSVRPAKAVDLLDILPLRRQDADEMDAQGRDHFDAMHDSMLASKPHVFTIFVDGVPSGVFGAGSANGVGNGVPWMLGNDRLLLIRRELVVESRAWIDYLNRIYPHLENWVDARNTTSIRWLGAMGFIFPGETIVLPSGVQFRRFTRDV